MFSYSVIAKKSFTASHYFAIIAAIAAPAFTAVTSIACVAMLVTWLMSGQALQSLKTSLQQPVGKVLLLFFAWLVVSSFYADTGWSEKITTLSSWKKLVYTFILLGFFYQNEWKTRFVYWYLTIMSIAALVVTPLWLLGVDIKGRGIGIVMTNYSAQSLAFVAAILCCIFLFKETINPQKKRILIALIALFLFNIFFVSPSRSGYLALPVAIVFAFINLYGYKKIPHILAVTLAALAIVITTSSTLQQRIKLGWTEKSQYQTSKEITSIGVRMIFAQNTWELIQQKPLLGYGTSSFKAVYSSHAAGKYQDWRGGPASDPHNQYLFILLENGIVGLILFLSYIYTAIKQGLTQQPYGALAASLLVAIATISLFNSNFKTFPEGHLLAFFVGCLLAQQPVNKQEKCNA
jgi:O-antigen ligase